MCFKIHHRNMAFFAIGILDAIGMANSRKVWVLLCLQNLGS